MPAGVLGRRVLDVLVEERLDERAAKLGAFLRNGLDDIASRHSHAAWSSSPVWIAMRPR